MCTGAQLAQCCDKQMELEKQIDNPDKDRIRYIEGKDLGPVELQKKIDDVSKFFLLNKFTCNLIMLSTTMARICYC